MCDPCGLVALPSVRNRREIWRVGLCQNSIHRNEPEQRVVAPFTERDDSAEGHVPAHVDRGTCQLVRARVAVQNACNASRRRLDEHRSRVVLRVARVNDDRQRRLPCQPQLLGKCAALLGTGRVVVVIVEATLADRDGSLIGELTERRDVASRVEPDRVVRMDSRRKPYDSPMGGRDVPRCASGAEDIPGAAAGADADNRFGSTFLRPPDYVAAVAVERRVGEVRVAVNVPFDVAVFLGHFLSIQSSTGLAM